MRKGFIKMTDQLYKENWKDIYIFFKDFRPTHIEFRHWENDIWYFYGESELFDIIKEGMQIPQYEVMLTRHNDNTITYEFKKVGK